MDSVPIFLYAGFVSIYIKYFLALNLKPSECRHVGSFFTDEEQKKFGWQCIWHSCHKVQPCSLCQWCRLLATKRQHSQSRFHDFPTLIFNKPGPEIKWEFAVSLYKEIFIVPFLLIRSVMLPHLVPPLRPVHFFSFKSHTMMFHSLTATSAIRFQKMPIYRWQCWSFFFNYSREILQARGFNTERQFKTHCTSASQYAQNTQLSHSSFRVTKHVKKHVHFIL